MGTLTLQISDQELAALHRTALELDIDAYSLSTAELKKILAQQARQQAPACTSARSASDPASKRDALTSLRQYWRPDPTLPVDGVEYQRALRAEWP